MCIQFGSQTELLWLNCSCKKTTVQQYLLVVVVSKLVQSDPWTTGIPPACLQQKGQKTSQSLMGQMLFEECLDQKSASARGAEG